MAIASALNSALDQGLRYRLMGLRQFLEDVDRQGDSGHRVRLNEISKIGELYQVFDAQGELIAESYGLARHHVPRQPPKDLGIDIRHDAGGTNDFPLRLAWQKVTIGGHTLILGAADPQRKFEGVLRAFTSIVLLSTPFILGIATLCGLWLGRRALAPVARITDDARAISESNLSSRLGVPNSRDELQQLSETLNDMLGRIEQSFTRIEQFTARRIARTARADDLDLRRGRVLAAPGAEPGRVGRQHGEDPPRIASHDCADRRLAAPGSG